MTQNQDPPGGAPETDILSAIRRIVDEEQGADASAAAPAISPAAAPLPAAPLLPAAPAPAVSRSALVLTPTMRSNAPDTDEGLPPLRLTGRIDTVSADASTSARTVRSAFGRDAAAQPLRLTNPVRVDDAPAAQAAAAPGVASAPEVIAAPDAPAPAVPALAETQKPAPDAAPLAAPAATSAPDGIGAMTREALDALITERLRQDLSGELGARISANIRTLVQREVAAAVAEATGRPAP